MRTIPALALLCIFSVHSQAQSRLTIDKLERADVAAAAKEVPFSSLLEGTVADPDLEVVVFVFQPHLKGWKPFVATVDTRSEGKGVYRWRAICQFGELGGKGIGDTYQARAVAFDRVVAAKGLTDKAVDGALKTEVIVVKRVK